MNTVYSYYDANGLRNFIEGTDVTLTGPWSSSGTYFAPPAYQATTAGNSLYICVTTNSGRSPVVPPTPTRYWSPLVIVTEGTQATSTDIALLALDAAGSAAAQAALAYAIGTNAQTSFSTVNLYGTHVHAGDVTTVVLTSGSLFSTVVSTPTLTIQSSSFTMKDDQNSVFQVKLHTANGTTAFTFTPIS